MLTVDAFAHSRLKVNRHICICATPDRGKGKEKRTVHDEQQRHAKAEDAQEAAPKPRRICAVQDMDRALQYVHDLRHYGHEALVSVDAVFSDCDALRLECVRNRAYVPACRRHLLAAVPGVSLNGLMFLEKPSASPYWQKALPVLPTESETERRVLSTSSIVFVSPKTPSADF